MFLKTDRTYIRPFVREDLDELCQLCTIPEAMRFIPPHFGMETKAQVTERLERYMQHYDAHNISFGYVSDLDGNFMGRAGFYFVPEVNQYEIGYSLLPEYWGQGLATEIADGLLDYAFSHLHLDTVCARTIAGNKNSEAVLYKNGFTFLGERAFSLNGHVCLWNYFERDNDDLSASVLNEVYAEDWDLVS